MFTLGIDIGASKVAAALVRNTKIVRQVRISYRHKTPSGINAAIFTAAASTIGNSKIAGIGFGVPCALGKNNEVLACANIRALRSDKIAKKLRGIYHVPVLIENDVKAATLAELKYGIGRKSKNFVFIAFGTGIGGAIVINGKLYKGTLGWAGEFGHTLIQVKNLKLKAKSFKDWEEISTKRFLKSEKGAIDIAEFAQAVGLGLLNITNALAPECIIIGGGLSSLWNKKFEAKVVSIMRRLRISSKLPLPKVMRSRFGENAGIIGAALL